MTAQVAARRLATVRRVATTLVVASALAYVGLYVAIAMRRIGYPFELEWMEGGMVDHVRRLIDGEPVYARPTIMFVSFLYPPGYYVVAAALAGMLDVGFLPLRLISFLSSLGVFALVALIVKWETRSLASGIVGAGLFAATYDRVGGWFDLARLDSFYLLELLAGIAVVRSTRSALGACVAGGLFGAAFLTKQSAVVILIPVAAYLLAAELRRAPWFIGTAALLVGGGTLALDRWTGGWFGYYCLQLPRHHPRVDGALLGFWTQDLLPALPLAAAAAGVAVAVRLRPTPEGDRRGWFLGSVAVGMVASSWSVRNMVGAEVNNLLPAFAAVAVLAAVGRHDLVSREPSIGGARRDAASIVVEVVVLAQLALLAYPPTRHLPTEADRAAGRMVVDRLRAIDGEVFAPHHGYLVRMAGKPGFAHTLAMDNVFLDDPGPGREALASEMLEALARRRFGAVLLESDGRYGEAILSSYGRCEKLFDNDDVFWPVTGGRLRPEAICRPE